MLLGDTLPCQSIVPVVPSFKSSPLLVPMPALSTGAAAARPSRYLQPNKASRLRILSRLAKCLVERSAGFSSPLDFAQLNRSIAHSLLYPQAARDHMPELAKSLHEYYETGEPLYDDNENAADLGVSSFDEESV